jgi:hypothetical protein
MNEDKKPTMFESLLAIQKELKTVTKNKKGYSGTYADIENVWESIRLIINSNGFVVLHQVTFEGVKTKALHISGESIESFIPFISWDKRENEKGKISYRDPQEQGKEITYAKRYNINAIFNVIVADEDNDANKEKGNYKKKAVDGSLAAAKLLKAKTKEEANEIYKTLSKEERNTEEVANAIIQVKTNLSI